MLTLLEAAKLNSGEIVRSTIIEHFARTSPILREIPFIDVPGLSYTYNLEGALPTSAFRGVNQGYTASNGIMKPETETLRMAGGELDVDMMILKAHGMNVRSQHELRHVKSLSLNIGATMINGSSVTDPLQFDGLRTRLPSTSNQFFWTTGANAALSVQDLRDLIDMVSDPTHLIMNKKMRNRLSGAAHDINVGGFISYDKDAFGDRVTMFDNLPIIVMDEDADGNQVMGFTEDNEAANATDRTSVYCVSLSDEGVVGLQNGVMEVRDLGEVDEKPVMRTRVEWMVGMASMGGRAAARLGGIDGAQAVVK